MGFNGKKTMQTSILEVKAWFFNTTSVYG